MNDPHVESLTFEMVTIPGLEYNNAPPVTRTTDVCDFELNEGLLTVRMRQHYSDSAAARSQIEPLLRAWEISAGLEAGRKMIVFRFRGAQVVDRQPTPGRYSYIGEGGVTVSGEAHLVLQKARYPEPLNDFAVTTDVEILWERYAGYREHRELLTSMAYFCLTFLERGAGGRDKLADDYNISGKVLAKLGRLTAKGDEKTARKLASASFTALTPEECAWIEAAVRSLIRRAGELAATPGTPVKQITMADLPSL